MFAIDAISQPNIVGWEAHVACAALYAQAGSPRIERKTFNSETAARRWIEEARQRHREPHEFACSVRPLFSQQ
jgi:hypothetical protein